MSDIHTRIKELRLELGLSMEALAKAAGVKSWQTVQQWEKPDGTAPKRERLQRVADALKTTKAYLLDGANYASAADSMPALSVSERKPHHSRKLVQQVCDLAEQIDDIGLRNLIDIAECLARNHPLTKAKPQSFA